MKAIVDGDRILDISEKRGTVEIGTPPVGVGLERLRWTGSSIVDLADLSQIWVRHLNGDAFDFHATEQTGAQLVTMTYQDRKKLTIDEGVIRLKTSQELEDDEKALNIQMLKNTLRKKLKDSNGDSSDQIADAFKLIFILIVYVRNKPQVLEDFLDSIIPDIKDVYDLDTVKDNLIARGHTLKQELPTYYQAKEDIMTD